MGLLTEDCEKWDDRPNVNNMWEKLQSYFTDVQRKMQRRKNQTANQTGFQGENAVLTKKLERANKNLINMAQMAITEKKQITMLTRTVAEFTRPFGAMEANSDRILAGRQGGGGAQAPPHPRKM